MPHQFFLNRTSENLIRTFVVENDERVRVTTSCLILLSSTFFLNVWNLLHVLIRSRISLSTNGIRLQRMLIRTRGESTASRDARKCNKDERGGKRTSTGQEHTCYRTDDCNKQTNMGFTIKRMKMRGICKKAQKTHQAENNV